MVDFQTGVLSTLDLVDAKKKAKVAQPVLETMLKSLPAAVSSTDAFALLRCIVRSFGSSAASLFVDGNPCSKTFYGLLDKLPSLATSIPEHSDRLQLLMSDICGRSQKLFTKLDSKQQLALFQAMTGIYQQLPSDLAEIIKNFLVDLPMKHELLVREIESCVAGLSIDGEEGHNKKSK